VIHWLRSPSDRLPDTRFALTLATDAPGLLAAGGELSPERLAEAYGKGVFRGTASASRCCGGRPTRAWS
jgi:leucyl/phenylalanyl-tRNA--protein transferase